jgi:hypothetical protein
MRLKWTLSNDSGQCTDRNGLEFHPGQIVFMKTNPGKRGAADIAAAIDAGFCISPLFPVV